MHGNAHFPQFTNHRRLNYLSILIPALLVLFSGRPGFAAAVETVPEQKPGFWQSLFPKQNPADDQKTKTMDSLTVIGSRLPSFKIPFSDVPANVSYISTNVTAKDRADIQKAQPRNYQEALRDTESAVFYDQVGNGVDTTFSLRGFNEGSAVVTLLDGVRMNDVDGGGVNYPLIDMDDIVAIQIDRGSASPIFGSGAFGGVVHLTSRKPSEKPISTFGGFELSSHKGIKFYNGVSGTLQDKVTPVGGKFKYYFKGGRSLNDGFRDNGETRITSFNFKSEYEFPEERGRVHFGIKHIDDAISNPGELPLYRYHENEEQTIKPLDGRDYKSTIVQFGVDTNFWEKRLSASILASWRTNLSHFYTTSASFPDGAFDPDTDLVTTKDRATDLVWQVGYQDYWADWLHNQTILGMEFRDGSHYGLEQGAFGGNVVEISPRENDRSAKPQSVGLFWRETLKFWDKVIPYVGMRHDFHRLKTTDYLRPASNFSRTFSDSTASVGLTVKPFEWNDIFANYSQGFRVPDISELAPYSGSARNLQPEKSDSYEVGTRLRYKKKAALKTSFFLIDMKDEIVFNASSINDFENVNVAKSRRLGVETRLDLKPIPEVEWYGSHTWMKAYVREINENVFGGAFVDGRSLGQIPENRITTGFFITPFARQDEILAGLRIGMAGVWTGKQHPLGYESTDQSTLDATGGAGHIIKSYSVWDFILSYTIRRQEVYFKITNVFGNKYYSRALSADTFGTAIQPAGTYTFVVPGAPREFQLGVRWEI